MATANPPDTPSADESVFDAIKEQIIAMFELITIKIISLRDQLLSEVDKKRSEFNLKKSAMIENVRELEEMRSQLKNTSVKQDLAMKKQQESLADLESEIVKLETDTHKNIKLKYSCSLDQLIQQVKQFGEIIDQTSNRTLTNSNYCHKLTDVQVFDVFERKIFDYPIRLHVDPHKELFYVINSSGYSKVMVHNANDFKFVQELGHYISPKHVTANKEFIYVLSSFNNINQFSSSDFSLVAEMESSFFKMFTEYIGISVSEDNQVILMHSDGSIKLFDRTLSPKGKIQLELKRFCQPKRGDCLRLVTKANTIYILLTNKILLFVLFGDWNNISCYFKEEQGKIPNVKTPSAFTIDSVGNIIVADSATNSIKFLSPEGDLIHTIGEVPNCSDIAVHKNSIIVACKDPETEHHNIRVY